MTYHTSYIFFLLHIARSSFVDTYSYYSLNHKNLKIIEWTHAISAADRIVIVVAVIDIAAAIHIERIVRVAGIRRINFEEKFNQFLLLI